MTSARSGFGTFLFLTPLLALSKAKAFDSKKPKVSIVGKSEIGVKDLSAISDNRQFNILLQLYRNIVCVCGAMARGRRQLVQKK
jgi:hypothetical protein